MPPFVPGLDVSGQFYEEVVRPIVAGAFPGLPYTAALIGPGSEVLGFDTAMSMDHSWGPRLLLFLAEGDHAQYARPILDLLSERLPAEFHGFSTQFGAPGPVDVQTIRAYFAAHIGLDPYADLDPVDWLTVPEQRLLTITAGRVYHDGLDELIALRAKFAYYPRDVWLYLLAAQWGRIGQEEAFVGRCGSVGDELGSRLVGARLVRDLMKLAFLLERRYAPYIKWFGTAFSRLPCGATLDPVLQRVLEASGWQEREGHLSAAYRIVATLHNALGVTAPLDAEVSSYYDRPFLVIHADRFVTALREAIADERVRAIAPLIGGVDQWVDSTDVLERTHLYRHLRAIYGAD